MMSRWRSLQRPIRWLQAISRTQATYSGAPTFAYDLCVRKIAPQERAGLDLSRWSFAVVGAEPVHAETLDRFATAFAACGFRREAYNPSYGLAEATLIVSGSIPGRPPVTRRVSGMALERHHWSDAPPEEQGVKVLVGCGQVLPGKR